MSSIFDEIGKDGCKKFTLLVQQYEQISAHKLYDVCMSWKAHHTGKPYRNIAEVQSLYDRWYAALKKGWIDYSVYGDPFYFCDVWCCWETYSRTYLRLIKRDLNLGVLPFRRNQIKSICDLGCGIAYATAGLKEIFPHASVVGTNLKGTSQYKIGQQIAARKGFTIADEKGYKGKHFDLVFASEFFEHILEPIDFMNDVISNCSPKVLILASTFTQPAIGHFPKYKHNGVMYEGKTISRMFNDNLKKRGYKKIKTNWWNNRPQLWVKDAINL